MQAALVREGGLADVGGVALRLPVQALVEQARDMGELRQRAVVEADVVVALQLQRGDQRDEVGVAAAPAEAVHRDLHLARAGLDRPLGRESSRAEVYQHVSCPWCARA